MGDEVKVWTSTGSAGTLSTTDMAKVTFNNAVVALGQEVLPPTPDAADAPSAVIPQISAVVRYNITPVEGCSSPAPSTTTRS
jgi:hypothetical protein